MLYILYGLFFASCIVLVGSVLLQPGKTDAGALFTSNVSSAAFAPRGTASVLSKMTIIAAAVFMVTALLISMPALNGNISVLNSAGVPVETTAPADANSNTQSDANANSAVTAPAANVEVPTANAATTNVNTSAPANK